MKQYYFPQTIFPVRISAREYATLVAQIPEGSVLTSKTVEQFLCHRHGVEKIELDGPLPKFYDPATRVVSVFPAEGMKPIPFYRVLSERGFVQETRSYSRETAVEMLRQEGHEVVQSGKGFRVEGYKSRLYDLRGAFEVEGKVE